jgi:hypothetical protein
MPLNMTKLAYGCTGLAMLEERVAMRTDGGRVNMTTRYRPKRADEMIGGSLYWIIAHQLVARAKIIEFADSPDGRVDIILEARVIPVIPMPKRAHQGWRYLNAEDAPADLDSGGFADADMPASMIAGLAELGLV